MKYGMRVLDEDHSLTNYSIWILHNYHMAYQDGLTGEWKEASNNWVQQDYNITKVVAPLEFV